MPAEQAARDVGQFRVFDSFQAWGLRPVAILLRLHNRSLSVDALVVWSPDRAQGCGVGGHGWRGRWPPTLPATNSAGLSLSAARDRAERRPIRRTVAPAAAGRPTRRALRHAAGWSPRTITQASSRLPNSARYASQRWLYSLRGLSKSSRLDLNVSPFSVTARQARHRLSPRPARSPARQAELRHRQERRLEERIVSVRSPFRRHHSVLGRW